LPGHIVRTVTFTAPSDAAAHLRDMLLRGVLERRVAGAAWRLRRR
jgi:hypothetical protein